MSADANVDGAVADGAASPAHAGARSALQATLIGFVAIGLWALLAALTTLSGTVPPFQLSAMAFAVAGMIGMAWAWTRGGSDGLRRALPRRPLAWIVGVGGLFGYHAIYFTALRLAPAVEASLIAYLWPLLIVLLSALLPTETLLPRHIIGALIGLAGAVLIVIGPTGAAFEAQYLPGYVAAAMCALVWSGYSVASRALGDVPTEAVAAFCVATAVLALVAHVAFEQTVWPSTPVQWLAVLGLGLGPVGGAFFVWDHGCKRGDIKVLGAASYAAPVLSTLVLIGLGLAAFTPRVAVACLLVTLGAVVASGLLSRRASPQGA